MMGDHRISVEISVTGIDGEVAKIDWWLNWAEDVPYRLAEELAHKANGVGLRTSYCEYELKQALENDDENKKRLD